MGLCVRVSDYESDNLDGLITRQWDSQCDVGIVHIVVNDTNSTSIHIQLSAFSSIYSTCLNTLLYFGLECLIVAIVSGRPTFCALFFSYSAVFNPDVPIKLFEWTHILLIRCNAFIWQLLRELRESDFCMYAYVFLHAQSMLLCVSIQSQADYNISISK